MTEIIERLKTAIADRYVIERELGQGGMATVYLAHDVKHDRKVALKVLRPELAAVIGAERFLAEIKTTANLQHPHILALFDSGEADGFVYYVMPYVEGESLRDRIAREHQLPVDEAVRIAREAADALEYAHGHGVVHRDIKPENILLHGGHALVADFGIALAVSRSDGGTRMTETGMSLGTPHYMSPEQAMGEREITPKADVYALGCVLYEALTGEPPFTGPTAQAIIARVMTDPPRSLTIQRHTIPSHVEAAVHRALEKLPADRFENARAFAAALDDPSFRSTRVAPAAEAARAARRPWRRRGPVAVAGVTGIALGLLAASVLRGGPEAPVTRYGVSMPAGQAPDPQWPVTPTPDGSRLVYVGPADGNTQLWVKDRHRYDAVPVIGTAGVTNFAVSPDGEWIAFTLGSQLLKVPVTGGAAITLSDSASGNPGLAWLDDNTIVYLQFGGANLLRVSANGGPVTRAVTDSAALGWPMPLPDGRGVFYIRCRGGCVTEQDLWVVDFASGETRRLIVGAAVGMYVSTGHILYVRQDGALVAVPFDLDGLEVVGSPVPIADSVAVVNGVVALARLSSSGMLVVRRGASLSLFRRYEMVWVDQRGVETPVDTSWTFRFTSFGANVGWALSPDGRRLAIGLATDAGDDIWVKRLPRGPVSRISFDSAAEYRPRWMPDGRRVMFGSNRTVGGVYARSADGTGEDSLLVGSQLGIFETAWSPDGEWLLFRTGGQVNQTGGRDIVGIRPGIDTVPRPILATPYDENAFAISPDGRWLAYESNETGGTEVFLRPFPETESGKWQVSNGGGVAPLWSRDGQELFFVDANRDMHAVTVAAGEQPDLGEPRRLFHLHDDLYLASPEFYTPYDIGPDGRFIMARLVDAPEAERTSLVVVENFLTEFRERVHP